MEDRYTNSPTTNVLNLSIRLEYKSNPLFNRGKEHRTEHT